MYYVTNSSSKYLLMWFLLMCVTDIAIPLKVWTGAEGSSTVIPRLTSDPAKEFFG